MGTLTKQRMIMKIEIRGRSGSLISAKKKGLFRAGEEMKKRCTRKFGTRMAWDGALREGRCFPSLWLEREEPLTSFGTRNTENISRAMKRLQSSSEWS